MFTRSPQPIGFLAILTCLLLFALGFVPLNAEDWPRFRGANGSGISANAAPTEFGEEQNMKWKAELPGRGVSCPIIVGDRVFVTCYSGYGMGDDTGEISKLKRHLICFARADGKKLWTATEAAAMPEDPYRGMGVPVHGYASHTPTSDGKRVYAFFGKSGVFAYDLDGKKLWHADVGKASGRKMWGSSSSPILSDGVLVVVASDESESMIGLDPKTGKELWKTTAGGLAEVFGTPVVAKGQKGNDILLAVPGETWAVNPETGKLRWYAPGNGGGSHSLIVGEKRAYSIGGSRSGSAALAIPLGGAGEIESATWEERSSSRFSTPLLFEGRLYSVAGDIFICYDAETGEELFKTRLPEKFTGSSSRGGQNYASPVLAAGKIYITDTGGTVYVVAAESEFKLIAKNDLTFDASGFNSSPALSNGDLFLRSNTHLYCIGK